MHTWHRHMVWMHSAHPTQIDKAIEECQVQEFRLCFEKFVTFYIVIMSHLRVGHTIVCVGLASLFLRVASSSTCV